MGEWKLRILHISDMGQIMVASLVRLARTSAESPRLPEAAHA
jgi:hypothetical protein